MSRTTARDAFIEFYINYQRARQVSVCLEGALLVE